MESDGSKMSQQAKRTIEEWILDVASSDYVDFWSIWVIVTRVIPGLVEAETRSTALDSTVSLLERERLHAGELVPPGEFVAWAIPTAEAIGRIGDRVRSLQGPPQPGDVAYFELRDHVK